MDYGALLQRILERLVPSLEGQGIPDEVDAAFDELGRASERLDGPAAAQGLRRLAACAKPNQSLAARNLAQRIGMDPVAWAAVQPARKERLMAEVVDVAVILRNEIFDELRPERYVPDATTSRVTERRTGSVPLAARRLAPAARLRAVGAAYRDSQVLTDVNLDLFAGEVVALVGANGSGKSTLLRLIAGIEPASTGDVTYPLLAVRGRSRNAILDQIQLVEQTPSPFPGTVEGALRAYGALRGVVRDGKFDHVASVMRTMELWQYRTNTYGELSSGYRMRFELSKAMVKLPTILLLDEPLGPLDSVTRRSFLRQVRDLTQARRPLCVVLTAVDESQTGHIANRTIILNQNTGPAGGPDLVPTTHASTFEVMARQGDVELAQAVAAIPGYELDLNSVPHVLSVAAAATVNIVAQVLTDAGVEVVYLREVFAKAEGVVPSCGQ